MDLIKTKIGYPTPDVPLLLRYSVLFFSVLTITIYLSMRFSSSYILTSHPSLLLIIIVMHNNEQSGSRVSISLLDAQSPIHSISQGGILA